MTYQSLKLQKFSEYTARQARELRLTKGILSMPERKLRAGISRETKQTVLAFYESEEISCQLPGKNDCVSIRLPDKTKMKKQKQLLLPIISEIYAQFKKENSDRKIGFSRFALLRPKWCIPVAAEGTHNRSNKTRQLYLQAIFSEAAYPEVNEQFIFGIHTVRRSNKK